MRGKRIAVIIAAVLLALTVMSVGAEGSKKAAQNELKFPTKPLGSCCRGRRAAAPTSCSGPWRALPKYFGQPMIIVNRDGAGGTIGAAEFVKADPDGYNIAMLAIGLFTTQPFMRDVQYTLDDFEGIIGLSYEPIIMVVHKDSPYNSIEDLVADAKKSGKSFKYGSSGTGSLPHLSQAAFFGMAGIKADVVAFAGGGPTVTALLGKHVDVAAAHPTEILPFVQDGQLKMRRLAGTGSASGPEGRTDVQGEGLRHQHRGLEIPHLPKGTPQAIKDGSMTDS